MSTIRNLVFLGYRREDSAPYALALKIEIEQELRASQIFMDTESIVGSDRWDLTIDKALRLAKAFVILIDPKWTLRFHGKSSHLLNENDWVYREVRFALTTQSAAIMPVLINGASPPKQQQLPEKLRRLAKVQCFDLSINKWEESTIPIIEGISKACKISKKNTSYRFPDPDPLKEKDSPYSVEHTPGNATTITRLDNRNIR